MSREVIFAGDDILAYSRPGNPTAPLVITFGAMPPTRDPVESGFGDGFLFTREINAVHVVPRRKHWYQTAEMAELLPMLRERRGAFARCVVYGSSMGAYAALLYAARLDADSVIAFSPQISVDPRKAGFDKRWRVTAKKLTFIDDDAVGQSRLARDTTILFDPFNRLDRRHAEAFAGPQVRYHPVPFAGHQVAGMLLQTGCLADLATDLIHDRFVWAPIRARMRAARHLTPTYWRGLFLSALNTPHHPRLGRAALDALIGTDDVRPQLLCAMARMAIRHRRYDLGLAALEYAVQRGADPAYVQPPAAQLSGRVPDDALTALLSALPEGTRRLPPRPQRMLTRLREFIGL